MIDPRDAAMLERILRREGRSLLQYVGESFPWAGTSADPALNSLQEMIAEERKALQTLGSFLVRRRRPVPHLGAFPMTFTSMNFLSLSFLLPRLIDQQRKTLALLEQEQASLADQEARAELDRVLVLKRDHLQRLENLAVSSPAPVK